MPLSLGDYVRAYPPASEQIAEMTREISARFGDDLVGGFRRTAAEAFEALERAGAPATGAGLEWIRRAAGRVPDDDPHLPLL